MKKTVNEDGFGHLVVVILIFVVLGVIGFTGWKVYSARQQKTTSSTSNTQTATTADSKVGIIAKLRTALAAHYEVSDSTTEPTTSTQINIDERPYGQPNGPAWQASGYDFYILGSGQSLSLSFKSSDSSDINDPAAKSIRGILIDEMEKAGIKAITNPLQSDRLYFKSDTTVCDLSANLSQHPMDIRCGQLSDYEPESKAVKPFADAYFAQNSEANSTVVVLGPPKVNESKTPGYQTAQVSVGNGDYGSSGQFYRKGEGSWHYLFALQAVISCSKYNVTTDAHAAYIGTTCYDDATNEISTLQ